MFNLKLIKSIHNNNENSIDMSIDNAISFNKPTLSQRCTIEYGETP